MNVETERLDGQDGILLSVLVSGRIDGSNATRFEETVRTAVEESDHAVFVDFDKLSYIDSAGLRAVLLIAKDLSKWGVEFVLCDMPDRVRQVFRITGFDKLIRIRHQPRGLALLFAQCISISSRRR